MMLAGILTMFVVHFVSTNLQIVLQKVKEHGLLLGSVTAEKLMPTNNPALLACFPTLLLLCAAVFGWAKVGSWRVTRDIDAGILGALFEWVMGPVSAALICAVVGIPWIVIVRTRAEPLPASSLFFVVRL